MRKSLIVIVVLFAIAAVQIAYYYPQLPTTIASHFNAAGVADGWEPKRVFFALYAFVLILITVPGLLLSRLILVFPPQLINLPNKQYWLAPQRRAATAEYFF